MVESAQAFTANTANLSLNVLDGDREREPHAQRDRSHHQRRLQRQLRDRHGHFHRDDLRLHPQLQHRLHRPAFAFSLSLFPGTYKVTVSGAYYGSNLPLSPFVVLPALTLTSNLANLSLNVSTVTVSGNVTLNGTAPTISAGCNANYGTGTVTFTETTYGYTLSYNTVCTDPTFAFSLSLFPGTYKVTVSGAYYGSNLPLSPFVAVPRLEVG